MKICILTHTFPRNKKDVSAAFMKEFADGLVENGNKVSVVTHFDKDFKRRGDLFKIYTYKYIWPDKFHILGYSRAMEADLVLRKHTYVLLPFMLLFGTLKLYKVVRQEKVDLINVHWILPNGLMALVVSKLTRIPYVVTLPGTDAYLAYRYKLFGIVAKFIASNAAGIVSNSSWHLNRIKNLGVNNKRTAVISYPADVLKFKPISTNLSTYKRKLGLSEKDFLVLAIGRLVYKKGFDYLIKAVASVAKKYPNIKLVIGGDGDLRKKLEDLSKKLKVSKKVLFVGNIARDEIIYYYNLADVMVAPSVVDKNGNVDGGPLVSLESMACGKPQIVTSILGVADVIKDNINGFVVPQKNVKALEEAIVRLIQAPALRRKMGKANRVVVRLNLSTKSIGRQYSDFFNSYVK